MMQRTVDQPVQKDTFSLAVEGRPGGEIIVSIAGRIVMDDFDAFLAEVETILSEKSPSSVIFDLAALQYIDGAGALSLVEMENRAQRRSIPSTVRNMGLEAQGMMELIDRRSLVAPSIRAEKISSRFFDRVGEAGITFFKDFVSLLTFLGELLTAIAYCIGHPRAVRWGDVAFYMKKSGSAALPIVGLISILIGLIMAFMSSLQLKQFGASIFVADLVGIAVVKELAPMMTAIVVAGRSGSAFAAEIGTMVVNEEVDALVTMGFDPIRFLAVPKVIAALIVVPLLTVYAMMFGIIGGLFVGVIGLDLTFYSYVQETMNSIAVFDVFSSLVKAAVFAFLIAGIGCQRGFQAFGGAESVGESTTSAVVSAIFLIIVTDSAFAIVFHYAF